LEKIIKIGTRESKLALWQANKVEKFLNLLGHKTKIIKVRSQGDLILDKPLYQFGITGIFTKTLDIALLKNEIDFAVHSMKDIPTLLAKNLVISAVLERDDPSDILIFNNNINFLNQEKGIIATGSLRRKVQWLNRYPNHQITDLRGNIITRLEKLKNENWNGAIFAYSGLDRISEIPKNHIVLDWMIPAPAQGTLAIVCRENDDFCRKITEKLNHKNSEICTFVERDFLKTLEGGCSAPIGALAQIKDEKIHFNGILLSIDGKQKIEINKSVTISDYQQIGKQIANEVLENGGNQIMTQIRKELNQ